jgi:phosphoribosylanthranilate isomerase
MLMKCKGSFDCEVASPGEATSSLRMTLVCLFAQSDSVFMTWIKICGMTNLEDAMIAVDAGADAVGFVFYEKSPRCVSVETAREICAKLPESVEKVGVFVSGLGPDPDMTILSAGLTASQQYFSSEPGVRSSGGRATAGSVFPKRPRFLMALPIAHMVDDEVDRSCLEALAHFVEASGSRPPIFKEIFDTFVLDSGGPQGPGGTGKRFDWSKAVPIAEAMRRGGAKLVVAGGLTSGNVAEAMGILKPWGVDVASGVESRPGKKDPEKVRAFVRAVREVDARGA